MKTRFNEWMARAMAEKATSPETYSFTLTYNDETEENRDGSRFFRYSDIRAMLKRITRAAEYKFGKVENAIRFICAGEIGSKGSERCHWHIIIYSKIDLLSLGTWENFHTKKPATTREEKITTDPNKIKRLTWQHWPHGFMSVQEPDQGGIAYAIIYALKDQFSLEKSKGTMRQHRSENFASGLFRMSKNPPIGGEWLDRKLNRLLELGSVLPNLNLNVEGYTGYWYPSGVMRQKLLRGLHLINEIQVEQTGRNAPQWSSLLATIDPETKDYEVLTHGKAQDQEELTQEEWELSHALKSKEADALKQARDIRRRCGGISPCTTCANGLSDEETKRLSTALGRYIEATTKTDQYKRWLAGKSSKKYPPAGDYARVDLFKRETELSPAHFCALAGLSSVKKAFR